MISDFIGGVGNKMRMHNMNKKNVSKICKKSFYAIYVKRLLDILCSALGIIMLSPLFLIIMILVKIKLGSPVIFKQNRPGMNERIFTLYKFRTMTDKKDSSGELLTDEERLTSFGRWLRSTSLDELPEFFNILKGDMSIVGPRPLLVRYLPYYTDEERNRHLIRPGLTGLAQIEGRNTVSWKRRFQLDVKYVQNVSFQLDLKILYLTIRKVIKKEGILEGKEHFLQDLDIERKRMVKDNENSSIGYSFNRIF